MCRARRAAYCWRPYPCTDLLAMSDEPAPDDTPPSEHTPEGETRLATRIARATTHARKMRLQAKRKRRAHLSNHRSLEFPLRKKPTPAPSNQLQERERTPRHPTPHPPKHPANRRPRKAAPPRRVNTTTLPTGRPTTPRQRVTPQRRRATSPRPRPRRNDRVVALHPFERPSRLRSHPNSKRKHSSAPWTARARARGAASRRDGPR